MPPLRDELAAELGEPAREVVEPGLVVDREISARRTVSPRPRAAGGARPPGCASHRACRSRLDRHRLWRDHGAGVDALVDVVDGRRRSRRRRRRARPRSGARRGSAGSSDGVHVDDASGEAVEERRRQQVHVAGAARRARRRAPRATSPSRRRAPRGRRGSRARTSRSRCPAARARSSAQAPGRFDATATIGSPASISACRFVPSPETRTPIIRDPSDHQSRPARLGDDGAEADAEVEDAAQLVLVDVPREPVEDRRPLPRVPVDRARSPSGTTRARLPSDAAARDVRERVRAVAQPPHVVEVEPRRREQVVAVVVVLLEDPPDEREAVRVHAGRREADDGVAGLDASSRRSSSSRSTTPTHVPAKSSSPARGRCRAARRSRRRRARHPAARQTSAAPSTSSATCSRSIGWRPRSRAASAGRRRS